MTVRQPLVNEMQWRSPGRKYEFPLVAFLTGAAVLVLELSATRILSPYFGNTIYSFSSVITTVLAALSAGYSIGGKRADKAPSPEPFYATILLGGFSVLALQVLSVFLLPELGRLPMVWGPLVAAAVMFFLPAFLLGMLSPHAVKLHSLASEEGIGQVSGTIFFWSTLGSLAGSLLTGFVLIPAIGLQAILVSVAGVLLVVGLSGLALHQHLKPRYVLQCVGAILLSGLLLAVRWHSHADTYVYLKDGVYERIAIKDKTVNGATVRDFYQDKSLSGSLWLPVSKPTSRYMKFYELHRALTPNLKTALFIGGGIYLMPRQLLQDRPEATVHVAEIEPSLKSLAERYFNLQPSRRQIDHLTDGRRLLQESDQKYDLVFSDVYNSLFSVPPHFTTKEFFVLAKSRLNPGGVFLANIIGSLQDSNPSFIMSELKTFTKVFPASYLFAVSDRDSKKQQNLVFVGLNRQDPIPFESFAVGEAAGTVEKFAGHLVDLNRYNFARHHELSDDYAPVEYFNAGSLEGRSFARSLYRKGMDVLTPLADKLRTRLYPPFQVHASEPRSRTTDSFDGMRALSFVERQTKLGARSPGSKGQAAVQNLLERELRMLNIPVYRQAWQHQTESGGIVPLANIVARFNEGAAQRILVGTHYDTRALADQDRSQPNGYMPGANDGASGTAVLLELARALQVGGLPESVGVDLIFFDGEEGEERNPTWRPIGSEYFASRLNEFYKAGKPILGIVVDMVGDRNLGIYADASSVAAAPEVTERFWKLARENYPEVFKTGVKHNIWDDHTSLNKAGIPSILLIDFDYPAFHTTQDTLDRVSSESLDAVGESLLRFVKDQSRTMVAGRR